MNRYAIILAGALFTILNGCQVQKSTVARYNPPAIVKLERVDSLAENEFISSDEYVPGDVKFTPSLVQKRDGNFSFGLSWTFRKPKGKPGTATEVGWEIRVYEEKPDATPRLIARESALDQFNCNLEGHRQYSFFVQSIVKSYPKDRYPDDGEIKAQLTMTKGTIDLRDIGRRE